MEPNERMKLLSEQAMLRQELDSVNELIPRVTPLPAERMPTTMEQYSALPEGWRGDVPADTVRRLMDKDTIEKELARRDAKRTQVARMLEGTGVASAEDVAALDPAKRKALIRQLTPEQQNALFGDVKPAAEEGYL